jgi:hypothetical protein
VLRSRDAKDSIALEDHEDHRAPFTLLAEENAERRTPNIQRRTPEAEDNSVLGVRCSMFDVCWKSCGSFGMQGLRLERPTLEAVKKKQSERLFDFLDRLNHGVEIGPVARLEFGMEQFAIGLDLECTASGRDKSERFNPVAEFENFCRQTDGFRRVVSNHAVFNRHFGLHASSFPRAKLSMRLNRVKPRHETSKRSKR